MNQPKIMYYHDGRHPHIYRYEPPMAPEEYIALVDELAGTTVEAIAFCLGEGRTMLHDTRAGELMGHNVEVWDHHVFRRAWQNAQSLIDAGHDPLRLVCDRAHELGIQVYPTLIVQRGGVDHASVRCSNFRIENQHLEIGAAGDLGPDYPGFDGLDFKHPEVRDERFAIVEEVMGEYPADGFELQLNQMPYFFHPDEIDAGRALMTDWIGRVHEAVKHSGPDKELVVHIPDRLDDCARAGLDPEEWVKRGLVDVIVTESFGENYRLKMQADYAEFIGLTQENALPPIGPLEQHGLFRPLARRAAVHAAGRGLQSFGIKALTASMSPSGSTCGRTRRPFTKSSGNCPTPALWRPRTNTISCPLPPRGDCRSVGPIRYRVN